MGIGSSFRRSGATPVRSRRRRGTESMKPLRHRDLRIERFEDRLLLSVTAAVTADRAVVAAVGGGPALLGISTDGTTNQGNTLTNNEVLNVAPQQSCSCLPRGKRSIRRRSGRSP